MMLVVYRSYRNDNLIINDRIGVTKAATKRTMLSMTSLLFDPLELGSFA